MSIDRSETIAGQPVKRVRDFLHHLDNSSQSTEGIAEHFAIDSAAAEKLVAERRRRDLLEEAWRYENVLSAGSSSTSFGSRESAEADRP